LLSGLNVLGRSLLRLPQWDVATLGQGEEPNAPGDGAGDGLVPVNRIGRRVIMCMLLIAVLAIIWNLLGH
jgi:hypothetical protein